MEVKANIKNGSKTAKTLVLISILSALIIGAKFVIAIPNVEIVTLLIMLYTVAFGLKVALSVGAIFVTSQMIIYGVGSWVISYYIYWELLIVVTFWAGKICKGKFWIYPVVAVVMTAMFGLLTSLIDTLFYADIASLGFIKAFWSMYVSGINFYVTQIVSNGIIVLVAFMPLNKVLDKLNNLYFGITSNQ